jgi:branched-chain amino acid transport system permease protein
VFPENFLVTESINILAMVILGGMGNLLGVVLGATLVVALPEVFRPLQAYRLLVFGLMLMLLMVFRPHGLLTAEAAAQKEEPDLPPAAEPEVGARA